MTHVSPSRLRIAALIEDARVMVRPMYEAGHDKFGNVTRAPMLTDHRKLVLGEAEEEDKEAQFAKIGQAAIDAEHERLEAMSKKAQAAKAQLAARKQAIAEDKAKLKKSKKSSSAMV